MNTINKFDSGLRLVHRKIEGLRSVAIGIFTGVGSANEDESNNGISHFIEHMLFKGTPSRSSFDIVCEIDGLGAQINAFTAKQMSCYYTVSIDEYAENCVEVLSDIYFNSLFDKQELERESSVVLEEIAMSEDTPDDLCLEKLTSAFYKGSSLGFTILGKPKNIKGFTAQDLRDYIADKYCADNTVISIVGNIDLEKAKDIADKYFEGKFAKKKSSDWHDKPFITTSQSVITIKDLEQSNIAFAFPSYPYGSDMELPMMLMNTIFGGGMSSRLFQDIREKQGLAYSVYSYPSAYINNGDMTIYLGTNMNTSKQAIASVRNEIERLKKDGLSEEEFERGKKQLKGAYTLGQESTTSLMKIYARNCLYANRTLDFDERINNIDKIKLEETKEVIDKIFDFDKVTSSYVGKKIDYDPLKVIKGE